LFLTLAEDMAQAGGTAECRTAISRAYYAVFNSADRFLERMQFHRPKTDYHNVLRQRLLSCGDPEIIRIGSDLRDLHHERVQADYRMDDRSVEEKSKAVAMTLVARTMIDALDGCPLHSDRWKNIRAAIAKANITGVDNLVDLSSTP
jgi:hypothetical protein